MILGTISSVDSANGLQLIIDGEDDATTKKYNYLASYVPTADDRVLIEEVGGSYVILGKIISDVESSGIARQAETATTAITATSATTAASAATAETCTGNAASSTVSNTTKGFDATVTAEYGQLVTNVQSQYSAQLGMNIVTGVTLGSYHSYTYKN